jgi:hypothetical protein
MIEKGRLVYVSTYQFSLNVSHGMGPREYPGPWTSEILITALTKEKERLVS